MRCYKSQQGFSLQGLYLKKKTKQHTKPAKAFESGDVGYFVAGRGSRWTNWIELHSIRTLTPMTVCFSEGYLRKIRATQRHRRGERNLHRTKKTDSPFLAVVSAWCPKALQRGEKRNTHNKTYLLLHQTHTHQLLVLPFSTNIKMDFCPSHRHKLHLFCNSRRTRSNVQQAVCFISRTKQ